MFSSALVVSSILLCFVLWPLFVDKQWERGVSRGKKGTAFAGPSLRFFELGALAASFL